MTKNVRIYPSFTVVISFPQIQEERKAEEFTTMQDHKMEMILDQKAYLEQMNKTLKCSLDEMKQQAQEKEDKDNSMEVS